ncbi:hypothetical protein [Hoeflea prorocentri]|uniref:Uncharacterized protein n=1 Tax=Hoeflea prorocentri TaxID=1922333 RepID=A0A9X3ZH72_9HYPH|nr:hypothetical protein [Hoeflea prorocentri]MCY6380596.1 hypothetical protein [Hoeflea prorocentri]MDA5398396.1 hypothetical protein [Hoeflea prorocentri]
MHLPGGSWPLVAIIVVGVGILFYLRWRRLAEEANRSDDDTGAVILAFSRAYPDIAVRDVITTSDGHSSFLRLADGRVGFVEHASLHMAARLLEPRTLEVGDPSGEQIINVKFPGEAGSDGHFEFSNATEAAEVSLWLCGGFLTAASLAESEGVSDRQ